MQQEVTMKFMKLEKTNVDNNDVGMNVKYMGLRPVSQVAIT